jgi:DNA-binding response OmpR family regulator
MAGEKILIVDDEHEIIQFVQLYLEKENFEVISAQNGKQALEKARLEKPSLIILDIMLPDVDGVDLCLQLRRESNVPIIFLSCKQEDIDKAFALSAGGDDYVTKPFSPIELVARVKAHLRRDRFFMNKKKEKEIIRYSSLEIHPNTYEVFVDDRPVKLSAKEFEILSILMKNPKRIYSSEQLYQMVWQDDGLGGDFRTVIVYIGNIRKKIEDDSSNPKYILNIRGVGYKFNHHLI